MRYLKIYELFRECMPDDIMKKLTLSFSILKTEHGWFFKTLKDNIYKKSWICLVNDKPIGVEVSESFSNLKYSNYLEIKFLDINIPHEKYYSDLFELIDDRIKSFSKKYSMKKKCIVISIDDIDSEEVADDINSILLFIQDYLDNT